MPNEISYKSYCWSIGTTSFRTKNFNRSIELQLELLEAFRSLPGNKNEEWTNLQIAYYNFLKAKGFIVGEANNPAKDAREKTSGLVALGLLNNNRELTQAGARLLKLAKKRDFSSDNTLAVDKDSFIYFKQLLKSSVTVGNCNVRPFAVVLLLLDELNYLTYSEFCYLAPLCINAVTTKKVVSLIQKGRRIAAEVDYDAVIWEVLSSMPNYEAALKLFQKSKVTENLICKIGMNRKSPRYDKVFYNVYKEFERIVLHGEAVYSELRKAISKIRTSTLWNKYVFINSGESYVRRHGKASLRKIDIFCAKNEDELKLEFFKLLHLIKAKATLQDYFDLNRRYIKATDVVIFSDDRVRLDVLPACYLQDKKGVLENIAFSTCNQLEQDVALEVIHPDLKLDIDELYKNLSLKLGINVYDSQAVKAQIARERYKRFEKLLDEKFTKDKLILLLNKFKDRDDECIMSMVTDNADIPTIFEYILAISWYIISGRNGDVLKFMNLSLEADLLPKTHAGGGEADIVWEYGNSADYPEHTLLIEATLADSTNQRRMEMEPVSRHLGEYLLDHPDKRASCVFISTYLDNNVVADFRGRRFIEYYSKDGSKWVDGMQISPMDIDLLILLLDADIKYASVYKILHKAYVSDTRPALKWYNDKISACLQAIVQ